MCFFRILETKFRFKYVIKLLVNLEAEAFYVRLWAVCIMCIHVVICTCLLLAASKTKNPRDFVIWTSIDLNNTRYKWSPAIKMLLFPFVCFQLDIVEFIPSLLYFGYTTLMVLSFWLLTGTIGFYAAYMFIRKIYAAVKIDWAVTDAAVLGFCWCLFYFFILSTFCILMYIILFFMSSEHWLSVEGTKRGGILLLFFFPWHNSPTHWRDGQEQQGGKVSPAVTFTFFFVSFLP